MPEVVKSTENKAMLNVDVLRVSAMRSNLRKPFFVPYQTIKDFQKRCSQHTTSCECTRVHNSKLSAFVKKKRKDYFVFTVELTFSLEGFLDAYNFKFAICSILNKYFNMKSSKATNCFT